MVSETSPGKSSTLGKRLNAMEKICCVFMRVVFGRDTAPADAIERVVPSSITDLSCRNGRRRTSETGRQAVGGDVGEDDRITRLTSSSPGCAADFRRSAFRVVQRSALLKNVLVLCVARHE